METTNPNEIQHGGEHYKQAGDAQHWDMLSIVGYGWEYYIGSATKYLTRVKDKENDVQKSAHYIDKLIWLVSHDKTPPTFRTTQGKRLSDGGNTAYNSRVDVESWLNNTYYPANNIDSKSDEAKVIMMLMMAHDILDLHAARKAMGNMLGEATERYVAQDAASDRLQTAMTTGEASAISGRVMRVDKDE